MGLWFPQGGATMASPPLWHTPRNVRVWGPHGPNFSVLPLVTRTAWESPWQPYAQMKALVEENILKLGPCGHLLWFGCIFEKCGCAHTSGGVYTLTPPKNAAKPQQVATSHMAPTLKCSPQPGLSFGYGVAIVVPKQSLVEKRDWWALQQVWQL